MTRVHIHTPQDCRSYEGFSISISHGKFGVICEPRVGEYVHIKPMISFSILYSFSFFLKRGVCKPRVVLVPDEHNSLRLQDLPE